MAHIKLKQWPELIAAKRGSILDAALAAGVPYPHSCRSGECGECKSMLHSGEVHMDGCAPEALSLDERDAGMILACRARPRGDVHVSWLADSCAMQSVNPVRQLRAKVAQIETVTHDVRRVRLDMEREPLRFSAGQYAELSFDGHPARPYSMANRPDNPTLEFHVRHMPNGTVSGHVHRELKVGDHVTVDGPYGTAYLREPVGRPLLLIAGGCGLAPIKSILLAALAKGAACPPIHLYHGVRDLRDLYEGDVIMKACAAGYPLVYTPVISSPTQHSDHRTGFVHDAVAHDFRATAWGRMADEFEVYLCGPPPMVDAATAVVLGLGARREHVHVDAFHCATGPKQEAQPEPQRAPEAKKRWGGFTGLFR